MSAAADVLVVGAGPTGLATALQAVDHGATVRIVERRPQAFRPSRAMVVHPRTLEVLRPLGVTERLLERGDRAPRAELHLGRRTVHIQLADVALDDTAFPHLTLVRQMDVEEVLGEALEERGVQVERGVELVDISPEHARVRATLAAGGASEETSHAFLVGCDGPDSTVRRLAGIDWRGAPYREEVVLADVELDGELAPGTLHVQAAGPGLVFLFALGEGATWRLLATRAAGDGDSPFGQPGTEVPQSELQAILTSARIPVQVAEVKWSARVRLQHRLAGAFRRGRVFLAGDAAHTHSPAAAQGMNTGILDACNLGWKLAFAVRGGGGDLLRSYDSERRPVARRVLALTHLAFFAEASTHPLPALMRGALIPLGAPAMPALLRQKALTSMVVRLLSQWWVRYDRSPLSVEGMPGGPGPSPGSRLPDEDVICGGERARLHDLTARPGLHFLLERNANPPHPRDVEAAGTVHRIASWPGRGVVVVRPDGHVGYRCRTADPDLLRSWLALVAPERLVLTRS